jgi:hypothetical protein
MLGPIDNHILPRELSRDDQNVKIHTFTYLTNGRQCNVSLVLLCSLGLALRLRPLLSLLA